MAYETEVFVISESCFKGTGIFVPMTNQTGVSINESLSKGTRIVVPVIYQTKLFVSMGIIRNRADFSQCVLFIMFDLPNRGVSINESLFKGTRIVVPMIHQTKFVSMGIIRDWADFFFTMRSYDLPNRGVFIIDSF